MTAPANRLRFSAAVFLGAVLFSAVLVWSYWTTLASLVWRWTEDPQYSHGWLVPLFALCLLWQGRGKLEGQTIGCNGLGLGLIAAATGLRLCGAYYKFDYFDQISLLPAVAGLFLLLGSWPALFWSLPAVAFLAFCIPLPHSVSVAMSAPMQTFATTASTFLLQALGRPALAEGNVILLNDIELGIVEACSGLRMLVVFFALSTAVSLLMRRPLWERLLIAGSAIPIALAANVLRITITGLCYDALGNHYGGALFHDVAGWLMMPLGLMMLGLEMWVLRGLLIEPAEHSSLPGLPGADRVEMNPVALYRGSGTSRRSKAAAAPAAKPAPKPKKPELSVEPVPQA
jgi:exosortase